MFWSECVRNAEKSILFTFIYFSIWCYIIISQVYGIPIHGLVNILSRNYLHMPDNQFFNIFSY